MKIAHSAFALLFVACVFPLFAQTPVPAKDSAPPASTEPLVVDVHASPYRATIYYRTNIGDQRFNMRDATILDIISLAYKREDEAIIGGPTWIDFDHFDVLAKIDSLKPQGYKPQSQANSAVPTKDPYDQIRPVLQRVLTERFHLTYHTDQRPLPGYIVTVAKEGSKLVEAKDPTAENNCQYAQDKTTPTQGVLTCTSQTLDQLFSNFGIYPHPVVNHTGLTKTYDFSIKFSFGDVRTREDYIRVFTEAFSKQLGLVVVPGTVPQPALVVDTVDRPTENSPEIVKQIPPLRDLEFEVATIKPAADDEPQGRIVPAGSQVSMSSFSVQELLVSAWQLPTGAMLGNVPEWLDQKHGKKRYSILVKLPPEIDARAFYQDRDEFYAMLQKLLIDRFQIKYHWGEQAGSGYVLLPGTPKMKKADPNSRSSCGYGAPEGEKSVLAATDSPYDREFYCKNVNMDQFAYVLQSLTNSEVKNRVANKTGLAGSYDITFYYTTTRKLRTQAAAAVAATKQGGEAAPDTTASDPVAGISLEDAFRKQLGMRLEKQPGTYPALILDHINETPTEN